jgi:hypothetical protein
MVIMVLLVIILNLVIIIPLAILVLYLKISTDITMILENEKGMCGDI